MKSISMRAQGSDGRDMRLTDVHGEVVREILA